MENDLYRMKYFHQDHSNPSDDASRSIGFFLKAIFVPQSSIFLFCLIICFYLVASTVKMSVVSSNLLFGFSEKAIAFICFYQHISRGVFLLSFAIYFSSIYLDINQAVFFCF